MKILVLGGGGMLGHKMFQTLRLDHPDTYCTLRGSAGEPPYAGIPLFQGGRVIDRTDALDLTALERTIRDLRPDVTLNGIGVIKQREAATHAIPSITVNALLPHRLARVCGEWGGRLVHFSTDCVFSGKRGGYTEDDPSDAEDLYGRTKFLGEVRAPNALTLRTSIIGRELAHFQSLLEWFLRQEGTVVRGYTRAIYSGVTTPYLARVVARLLREHPSLTGLYQVTGPAISKYDLLLALKDAFGVRVEIQPDATVHCDRSMRGDKFYAATGYTPPSWPDLAHELAEDPTPYQEWRSPSGNDPPPVHDP